LEILHKRVDNFFNNPKANKCFEQPQATTIKVIKENEIRVLNRKCRPEVLKHPLKYLQHSIVYKAHSILYSITI
jgi:hypothetical protein